MDKIAVVVPCYNEMEAIPIFYEEICKIADEMKKYVKFEFIFVNDGSSDDTLNVFRTLANQDKRVRYVSFSRNFGKEAAMLAGLERSTGDFITIMDVDLQDPPYLLKDMYHFIKEDGYDCVAAKSTSRNGYSFFRKLFTKWFYFIIGKISKIKMVPGARDYRLMTRQMLDSVLSMTEYNRYSKGLFEFVGFDTKWIEYENQDRSIGVTKWDFCKLFSYAIEGITAFSTMPLVLSAVIGIIFCLIAFVMIVVIIVKTLIYGDPVSGWPSLACIVFLVGGVQLFCTGIMGQYLAKTYLETKHRPLYIVKETEKDNV